jgi:hypothetical protein
MYNFITIHYYGRKVSSAMEFEPVVTRAGSISYTPSRSRSKGNFGEIVLTIDVDNISTKASNRQARKEILRKLIIDAADSMARTSRTTPPRIAGNCVIVTIDLEHVQEGKRRNTMHKFAHDLLNSIHRTLLAQANSKTASSTTVPDPRQKDDYVNRRIGAGR